MALTPEQAEILLSADESNLAAKVKAGKTLTLKERARLESIRGGTPEPDAYCTTKAELARALGVTRQRLQFHSRRRDFPKPNDAGQYRTADVLAYARKAGLIPGPSGQTSPPSPQALDLYTERALLTRAQRESVQIANAAKAGQLLEAVAVEAAWDMIRANVRQKILALPAKVESQCNLPTEPRSKLRKLLDREIDDLLTDLAAPPDYKLIAAPTPAPDEAVEP